MTHKSILGLALAVLLVSGMAIAQTQRNNPADKAAPPPASSFKEAVEKTKGNTGTRSLPTTEVAVLYLTLDADKGKLRRAKMERMVVVNANPPKVFARSNGTWEVRLEGEQKASYRIRNPLQDIEVENESGSPSPYSQVELTGPVPVELIVPLSRDGKSLGVGRIQIMDTETGKVILDTPVRRQ